MLESFIALASIFVGILGAHALGFSKSKYSLGILADTLSGVFGSIFCIKTLGRLGFNPQAIINLGAIDLSLLSINFAISFLGGALGVYLVYHINRYAHRS